MLGFGVRGIARRLIMFHGFFKVFGIVVMAPLLGIEVSGGAPLIKAFVQQLSHSASTQVAVIYLLYEIITGIAISGFLPPIARWFERQDTTLAD
uniref:Uncharacterized protein n=1 Tax=Candidatus Kentrum sp. MB TaxID=2138164 RepID=A0A450XUN2_9GAMM|nr:MAG: hypothetical protein BECKMB1821G_GA0114241_11332 [Candidatus Kentron sp. MB]VFK35716.1 MAG: hypothetical protein BECKMB1821I_GA0114274_11396 [Candidatus Kentron sp. MB]VFK77449.1 MAG: hypothetical protein BECKMB1821H_GA0114242_11411 [Candidatus Kentron sp. MB]